MTQDKFVVIDFAIRLGDLPKGVKKVVFSPIAERATKRIKEKITKTLDDRQERVAHEYVGAADKDKGRFVQIGSIIVKNPTMQDVLRIEDALRRQMKMNSEDSDGTITLKMQDSTSKKYLTVDVNEFRMSGPRGGAWKPFVEWYKGAKDMGLA